MDECGPALGAWPLTNQWLLMYPMHGHLLLLEQQGRVTRLAAKGTCNGKLQASLAEVAMEFYDRRVRAGMSGCVATSFANTIAAFWAAFGVHLEWAVSNRRGTAADGRSARRCVQA
jgi:hypothetical protein